MQIFSRKHRFQIICTNNITETLPVVEHLAFWLLYILRFVSMDVMFHSEHRLLVGFLIFIYLINLARGKIIYGQVGTSRKRQPARKHQRSTSRFDFGVIRCFSLCTSPFLLSPNMLMVCTIKDFVLHCLIVDLAFIWLFSWNLLLRP